VFGGPTRQRASKRRLRWRNFWSRLYWYVVNGLRRAVYAIATVYGGLCFGGLAGLEAAEELQRPWRAASREGSSA
jgi:hypothetical protein